MDTIRKKRTFTIETRGKNVIRQDSPQTYQIWCEFCAAEVEMISPELAAQIFGINQREVFRRIEQKIYIFLKRKQARFLFALNT